MLHLAIAVTLLSQLVDGQTAQVNQQCDQSTDCGTGSFCQSNKRCGCLSTYIEISGFCWPKVNPGQSGCTQDRQCSAVWPGAYCSNGACRCANNQPPFLTSDGFVCVNYGFCPINGDYPKLRQATGLVQPCAFGLDTECHPGYDCICSTPITSTATCTTGSTFCCPSRAFACIQGPDEGDYPPGGGSPLSHWYYDTVTSQCKVLNYRGRGGNANNFQTREHCESYCGDTCQRGRPIYNTIAAGDLKASVRSCSTGDNCPAATACSSIGTIRYCCPTVVNICSKWGGFNGITTNSVAGTPHYPDPLTVPIGTTEPVQNFDVGIGSDDLLRYYYDETTRTCQSFRYLGQAGNFNNFLNPDHCNGFCSQLVCEAGEPLKDSGGVTYATCSSNTNCPSSHTCRNSVCCPTKQFVCKMPKVQGTCGSYTNRWWFNAATGNCELFLFSGCQGNANNFATSNACQTFCRDARVEPQCVQGNALTDTSGNYLQCGGTASAAAACPGNYYCFYDGVTYGCCPTQAFTCSQQSSAGRQCGPPVNRWYFNAVEGRCQGFAYNGCDGNSNNFANQQDCKDYCRVESCPDGGDTYKEPNGQVRVCDTDARCPSTHYCTPVAQPGGSQSTNNCCPRKKFICSQPKSDGTAGGTLLTRYYFNPGSRRCEPFEYRGLGGNDNNFPSQRVCENFCYSSACEEGSVVLQDVNSNLLTRCTRPGNVGTASGGCPSGYTCTISSLLRQNVCCGARQDLQSLCPTSSQPYISALSLQPLQCTPNVDGSCPGNFFCWFSAQSTRANAYYCCRRLGQTTAGGVDTGLCPPDLGPIPGSGVDTYRFCSPNAATNDVTNGCAANQFCQYSSRLQRYICCGASAAPSVVPNVCPPQPAGLTPTILNGDYRRCSPNVPSGSFSALSCPTGAACLWTGSQTAYICCQAPALTTTTSQPQITTTLPSETEISEDCSGQIGFLPVTPVPQSCSPFVAGGCDGFSNQATLVRCLWSTRLSQFVCCRSKFRKNAPNPQG